MWGAIAGAVGAIGSSLISSNSAKSSNKSAERQMQAEIQMQRETNAHNSYEAALTRMWQEGMSNTAHRRELVDLYSAGLNPILTATGGPGASTPSGATAQWESPGKGTTASVINMGKNKIAQTQQLMEIGQNFINNQATMAQTRLADQQTLASAKQQALTEAQERKTDAETLNIIKTNPKIEQETKFIEGMIKLNSADAMKREQEIRNLVQELETSKQLALKHAAEAKLSGNKSLESQKTQEAQELELRIQRAANESGQETAPWRPYLDAVGKVLGTVGDTKELFRPFGGKK